MLPIFILEDDSMQRKQMEIAIRDYAYTKGIKIHFALVTDSPSECIQYLDLNPNIRGLYFLDINLGEGMDGLELGKHIKARDPGGRIVVVTGEAALAYFTFTYKLEALDFIVKKSISDMNIKIRRNVQVAYERFTKGSTSSYNTLDIKVGGQQSKIPVNEVCIIETGKSEHSLVLHTLSGRIEFTGYMREYEEEHPNLLRAHRSFLVNMDNVKMYHEDKGVLEMIDGEFYKVAVRKRKTVKDAWKARM